MQSDNTMNEAQRLRELQALEIMDTPPDMRFDRITELVADLIGVPIALITLLDERRQWFKSRIGLDATETPRQVAFCDHAIRQPSVMVIEDATQDERFAKNPLVAGEPHIRFYAGAPLVTPTGMRLGTLCAVGMEPRSITPAQISTLEALSGLVVDAMQAHRLAKDAQAEAARALAAELESRERQRELVRANRALDQFAGVVSHDLRAPLRHIRQYAAYLDEIVSKEGEAGQLLQALDGSAVRMQRLIESMLRFARASNQATEKTTVDLKVMVDDACETPLRDAEGSTVDLNVDTVPSLHCDAHLISQVFNNLLANAVAYASERPLRVAIEAAEKGDMVEISVSDNGIGIDARHSESVFEPFKRLHADTERFDGNSGIGLALCRNIVESHGGSIWLDTSFSDGACFRFTLPIAPDAGSKIDAVDASAS